MTGAAFIRRASFESSTQQSGRRRPLIMRQCEGWQGGAYSVAVAAPAAAFFLRRPVYALATAASTLFFTAPSATAFGVDAGATGTMPAAIGSGRGSGASG
jgi:hypothetical protein